LTDRRTVARSVARTVRGRDTLERVRRAEADYGSGLRCKPSRLVRSELGGARYAAFDGMATWMNFRRLKRNRGKALHAMPQRDPRSIIGGIIATLMAPWFAFASWCTLLHQLSS